MPEEIKRTFWYLFGRKFVYGQAMRPCHIPGRKPGGRLRPGDLMKVREDEADLVGSLTETGKHAPALDIDYPTKLQRGSGGMTEISIKGPFVKVRRWNDLLKALHACDLIDGTTAAARRLALPTRKKRERLVPLPSLPIAANASVLSSSSVNHFHLYIEREMPWERYAELLSALRDAGVIGKDFCRMSIKSKQSFLLKPGLRKQDILAS